MISYPDVRPEPDHRAQPWHWVERPHAGWGALSPAPVPAFWDEDQWQLLGSPERYTPDRAATLRWRYIGPLHFTEDFSALIQRMADHARVQESHIMVLERALSRRWHHMGVGFICGVFITVVIITGSRALY